MGVMNIHNKTIVARWSCVLFKTKMFSDTTFRFATKNYENLVFVSISHTLCMFLFR